MKTTTSTSGVAAGGYNIKTTEGANLITNYLSNIFDNRNPGAKDQK